MTKMYYYKTVSKHQNGLTREYVSGPYKNYEECRNDLAKALVMYTDRIWKTTGEMFKK